MKKARTPSEARDIFLYVFGDSKNFMTPHIERYGVTQAGNYVYEVSSGEGIDRQPLYGVTVIDCTGTKPVRDHDKSRSFTSKKEIGAYLRELAKGNV